MVTLYDKGRDALEELMNEVEMIATATMRAMGEFRTMLFVHGENAKKAYRPRSMETDREKDQFALDARMMCVADNADAVVYCSEAWMRTPKKDEALDISIPPSKAADRQEVLVMVGENREGYIHRSLPIIRNEQGKFAGFGEAMEIRPDKMEGRFANLLLDHSPTNEERLVAHVYLKSQGYQLDEDKRHGQDRGQYRR